MPLTDKPLISLGLFQLTDLYNLIASIDWLTPLLAYKLSALTYIDWLISHSGRSNSRPRLLRPYEIELFTDISTTSGAPSSLLIPWWWKVLYLLTSLYIEPKSAYLPYPLDQWDIASARRGISLREENRFCGQKSCNWSVYKSLYKGWQL